MAHMQTQVLSQAIARHGLPQIVNSDQGSYFTTKYWMETLKFVKIRICMDGKGRAMNNAYIEHWFRGLNQKYTYLNPAENGHTLHRAITSFIAR
jgi:putative transposase